MKDKKYRKINKLFIVEGEHLIKEAHRAGKLKELVILNDNDIDIDVPKTFVTKEIINKITELNTSLNMLGICSIEESNELIGDKYLLLDGIQDPGNLGTIIRTAKAFDIDTIILSPDTVDLYNPKVVRATQGIMFHTNIVNNNLVTVIEKLKEKGIRIYGTDVDGGMLPSDIPMETRDSFALIMGNEGSGIKENIQAMCDDNLYIRMNREVESLNVAVATSIILYELSRR